MVCSAAAARRAIFIGGGGATLSVGGGGVGGVRTINQRNFTVDGDLYLFPNRPEYFALLTLQLTGKHNNYRPMPAS